MNDVTGLGALEGALRRRVREMTPTLAQASRWMADHLVEIAWRTIDEVSAEAGVSPASVVRCCQLVGFSGYSSLQRAVRDGMPPSHLVRKLMQEQEDEPQSLLADVIQVEHDNLSALRAALEPMLPSLVDRLVTARRIGVAASLTSAPLAQYLATQLNILLGNVQFFDSASSAAWLFYRDADEADLLVALTFPRYARATLALVRQMTGRQRGAAVLITDPVGPPGLQATIEVRLPVASHVHFSSGTSVIVLTQTLARLLADRDPERILARLEATDAVWAETGQVVLPAGHECEEEDHG